MVWDNEYDALIFQWISKSTCLNLSCCLQNWWFSDSSTHRRPGEEAWFSSTTVSKEDPVHLRHPWAQHVCEVLTNVLCESPEAYIISTEHFSNWGIQCRLCLGHAWKRKLDFKQMACCIDICGRTRATWTMIPGPPELRGHSDDLGTHGSGRSRRSMLLGIT